LLTQRPTRDAPKREQLEYWLGHFGQIDLLTELPNRSQFLDRLSGAMARAIRSKQLVGVMLLNLDHFKALNATYGHQVADVVLKKLAERLKDCTRKSDTVARLGGDEFAVILEGLNEKEGAAIATQRLLKALARPLQLDSGEIAVTATVGASFFLIDNDNVDTLLQTQTLRCPMPGNITATPASSIRLNSICSRRDQLREDGKGPPA
jgi:diguanylate cyclase (GGDEF)-like protein